MEGSDSPPALLVTKERYGQCVCVPTGRWQEGQGAPVGDLTAETWQSCHSHGTPMLVFAPKGKVGKL